MALNAKTITNKEYFYGHKACGGCGAALAIRLALKVLGDRAIAVIPPNCMSTVAFIYPHMPLFVNGIVPPFAATASTMSGVLAGAKAQGLEDYHVVGFAGDGGTADIGLQALSGMIDRNDKAIFICYDNEAYMNTGVQRSSAAPPAARTATTQVAGDEPGNAWGQGKDVPLIAMAHGIPYVATATVADLRDLERKVTKAMSVRGARYIHILVPCPLGWGHGSGLTVQMARMAQQTGIFPVFEAEYGEVTGVSKIRRKIPVEQYLKPQKRFAHLFGKNADLTVIARIQAMADRNIKDYGLIDEEEVETHPTAVQGDERAHHF